MRSICTLTGAHQPPKYHVTPKDMSSSAGMREFQVCRQKLVLLVVPKTVITNWQREFSTWGAFGVVVFHGDEDRRSAALQKIEAAHAEVLITSYETCR